MSVKEKIFNRKVLFLLVALILFTSYKLHKYSDTEKTDNAYIEADISTISSEVSGVIQSVLVEENQEVSVGDPVAVIGDTTITSPIAGTIAMHKIRLGNYVQPGMPLAAVVPKNLYLRANFKETQIDSFSVASEVKFTVDALKNTEFKGKVKSIYPATGSKFSLIPPDNATGNFTKIIQRIPVIIEFDNNQEGASKLKAGMSSIVTIQTK